MAVVDLKIIKALAGVLDGTFAVGDGTAQREIERLRAEVDLMQAVVMQAEKIRDARYTIDSRLGPVDRALSDRLSEVVDAYRRGKP